MKGGVAANTGHISTHEAGAIECGGHKVLELPGKEGKLQLAELRNYLQQFYADPLHEHMVFPGMVFISYPTEYGTLYSKKELEEIYALCKQYNILLYIDGARLGYGLASKESDLTLAELARLCDVFYIGGTKQGALFGEAVVFCGCRAPAFNTFVKQRGGLLAKGWLLGLQFDVLFEDDLYFKISNHANLMAEKVKDIFLSKGYSVFVDASTNQQFMIVDNEKLKQLEKEVKFSYWQSLDENSSVIRLVTSWATKEADVEKLRTLL